MKKYSILFNDDIGNIEEINEQYYKDGTKFWIEFLLKFYQK